MHNPSSAPEGRERALATPAPASNRLPLFAGLAWLIAGALLLMQALPALTTAPVDGHAGALLGPLLWALGSLAAGALVLALLWGSTRRRVARLARVSLTRRRLPLVLARPALWLPVLLALAALLAPPAADGLGGALALLALGLSVPAFGMALAHLLPVRPPRAPASAADLDARTPIGVLLLDAEEPEAPRARAVRRHLKRVLGDRLTQPRRSLLKALWRRHVVAPWRARKLAREYRRVWTAEGGPRTSADACVARALLRELGPKWRVSVSGPREGGGLGEAIDELLSAGCQEIRVVPLLPQYSVAGTGARIAELHRRLARRRLQPALRLETSLYRLPGFTRALAERVREHLGRASWDRVVLAFPGRYVTLAGDPYEAQCRATAQALARELGLPRSRWEVGFSDDVLADGSPEPRLSELLFGLAPRAPRVLVVPAGITTDGVETLHGLAVELAAAFQRAGGSELRVVPALNDQDTWIAALAALVRGESDPGPAHRPDPAPPEAELEPIPLPAGPPARN